MKTEVSPVTGGSLLTPAEAAEYLGVTERWIRRAVTERRIAVHRIGKLLRFAKTDLDSYLELRRTEAVDR